MDAAAGADAQIAFADPSLELLGVLHYVTIGNDSSATTETRQDTDVRLGILFHPPRDWRCARAVAPILEAGDVRLAIRPDRDDSEFKAEHGRRVRAKNGISHRITCLRTVVPWLIVALSRLSFGGPLAEESAHARKRNRKNRYSKGVPDSSERLN
jgi:hypothetical protein